MREDAINIGGVPVAYVKRDAKPRGTKQLPTKKRYVKRSDGKGGRTFIPLKEKPLVSDYLLKDPRFCAIKVVCSVIDGTALPESLTTFTVALTDQERRFTQYLVYGVFRFYDRLIDQLGQLMNKPIKVSEREVYYALLLSIFEVTAMATAEYALVNNWVNLIKKMDKPWAVGLVNAILRGILRSGLPKPLGKNAKFNMPGWLIQLLENHWGTEHAQKIGMFFEQHPVMTLRINEERTTLTDYLAQLAALEIKAQAHKTVNSALVLEVPINVHELPGFSLGMVSVQDASAQLASKILAPTKDQAHVLDACAAPGGKTLALLEQFPTIGTLVALDSSAQRLQRVCENIERVYGQNYSKVTLTAELCESYITERLFDYILLDVPCSGTGIIHRHPDIKRLRTRDDVGVLVKQQQALLAHAWTLLKPGGRLLYSTCSILKAENVQQLVHFFAQHTNVRHIPLALEYGVVQTFGYQILPVALEHDEKMDGFYYCLLEKTE